MLSLSITFYYGLIDILTKLTKLNVYEQGKKILNKLNNKIIIVINIGTTI